MIIPPYPSIPIELMEILNVINDNVNEVKDRITRLEAQNHSDNLTKIWLELEKERDKRIRLEIEMASMKTRLAPIVGSISIVGAVIIEALIRSLT